MAASLQDSLQPGYAVRVLRTGLVGRVQAVDNEWARLFPHKGPMLVLDIQSDRHCYSLCEVEPLQADQPRSH